MKKIGQQELLNDEDDYEPWGLSQKDKIKIEKIKEIIKSRKSKTTIKIHFSETPIPSVTCRTKQQTIDPKPQGIWYECDGEWLDFAETDFFSAISKMNYIYEIFPNEQNIKIIRNERDIIQFTKEYGIWEDYQSDISLT